MLASDRRANVTIAPDDLLSDPRVVHFWDEKKIVGRFYETHVTKLGESGEDRIEWDAYFLYRSDARWGDAPPEHVSWGRTIVRTREQLREDLASTLARER